MCGPIGQCSKAALQCRALGKSSCSDKEDKEKILITCFEENDVKTQYDEFCKFFICKLAIASVPLGKKINKNANKIQNLF